MNFFSTNLTCKYIKYLLMNTYLPTCSYINPGEYMTEGITYAVDNKIVTCTKSGKYLHNVYKDTYPLTCSKNLICGSIKVNLNDPIDKRQPKVIVCGMTLDHPTYSIAEYETLYDYSFGKPILGHTDNFISKTSYYDSETHIRLGEYLRCLNSAYNMNLMPLYNCFANLFVENIDLSSGKVLERKNAGYKTTLVPIKFNKKYTIYINSNTPIYIKPLFYNKSVLRDGDHKQILVDGSNQTTRYNRVSFNNPIVYSILSDDIEFHSLGKFLYLAIQIPATNTSPITVLEGEYNIDLAPPELIELNRDNLHSKLMTIPSLSKNKLLDINSTTSLAFSDKLIQYLLSNTVDSREMITQNISRLCSCMNISNMEELWNDDMRKRLFYDYVSLKNRSPELNYDDILGYLDSDIESAISKGLIYPMYDRIEVQ